MALKKRIKIDPNFSMSSMTDIVFLLLIFFMITSTLVSPYAMRDLDLPNSDHQASAKPNTTVSITSDLRYYVEDQQVWFDELENEIRKALEGSPEMYIALHVDKSVPFSEVGKIRDIAIKNKYKLILATKSK